MTSWHRYSEPLASVDTLPVFIPPIKHRKGKNLEPASAEGVGGRQNHGMSVCLLGTVGWDRCLSRETLGQLFLTAFVPDTAGGGGEPWFMGKRVVCQRLPAF